MADLTTGAPLLGDASALSAPVGVGELRRYHRANDLPWTQGVAVLSIGAVIAVAVCVAAAILLQPILSGPYMNPLATVLFAAAPLVWAALVIGGFAWWLRWRLRDVRLWRFARANGLGFADRAVSGAGDWRTARPGTGFPRDMRNLERAILGRIGVTVARNQVMPKPGDGRANVRRPFAFAQLDLPREVPHIILKNRRSRILPLAGLGLGNRRRLSLEGDFDRHFTLLCPDGYERDALEVFTPDVMAAVIDVAGSCEVELIDDHLLLYFRFATPLWRAETMDRLQRALALLQDRFTRQTRGYRDDRADPSTEYGAATAGGVSLGGRRTTSNTGVSAATVLTTAAVILLSGVVTVLTLFVFPNLG